MKVFAGGFSSLCEGLSCSPAFLISFPTDSRQTESLFPQCIAAMETRQGGRRGSG